MITNYLSHKIAFLILYKNSIRQKMHLLTYAKNLSYLCKYIFQNELGQISHKQRFAQFSRALKMLLKYDRMTTLDYLFCAHAFRSFDFKYEGIQNAIMLCDLKILNVAMISSQNILYRSTSNTNFIAPKYFLYSKHLF